MRRVVPCPVCGEDKWASLIPNEPERPCAKCEAKEASK